mmetsp:Transcript_14650/g.62841  ORF Transcript_14650/g.62841 Transcript_14650/m.62841 type:complete len:249 (-) Transcript_14650:2-748(-)
MLLQTGDDANVRISSMSAAFARSRRHRSAEALRTSSSLPLASRSSTARAAMAKVSCGMSASSNGRSSLTYAASVARFFAPIRMSSIVPILAGGRLVVPSSATTSPNAATAAAGNAAVIVFALSLYLGSRFLIRMRLPPSVPLSSIAAVSASRPSISVMNASTGDIGLASVAATAGSAIAAARDPNNTPRRDGVPEDDATSSSAFSETARGTTARPRRALRRGPAKDAADASAIEGSITDVDIFARFSF